MNLKSERLKKFETELSDLQKWLDLGLVPKKDIEKHREEIITVKQKIEEEKERLKFMKESGDMQDYVAPKKSPPKQSYQDAQTMSDMDVDIESEIGFDETESFDKEQDTSTEDATFTEEDEEEEDPFSDRNRWKRGILEDPDADNW